MNFKFKNRPLVGITLHLLFESKIQLFQMLESWKFLHKKIKYWSLRTKIFSSIAFEVFMLDVYCCQKRKLRFLEFKPENLDFSVFERLSINWVFQRARKLKFCMLKDQCLIFLWLNFQPWKMKNFIKNHLTQVDPRWVKHRVLMVFS